MRGRNGHSTRLIADAMAMRANGHSYGRIAWALRKEYRVHVGESTVRDWVKYRTRTAA